MGIFTRFTLRSLARNRTRTVVSIIGIALSCALITAVITSAVSMTSMLYHRTAADEGTWQAEIQNIASAGWEHLQQDPDVTGAVAVAELGTVALGADNAADYGSYLLVKTWPELVKSSPAAAGTGGAADGSPAIAPDPEIVSGRAPEAPGEIVLPHFLKGAALDPCGIATEDGGTIALGSEVALELGTRTVTDKATGASYVSTSELGTWVDEDGQTERYLADLGRETATVVGFYRSYGYSATTSLSGTSIYTYDDGGAPQRVAADDEPATQLFCLITVADPQRAEDIADAIAGDDAGIVYHTSLLRWQGVTDGRAIWNTLYQIAGILAAVVMIAGVSLIYNAFAISVAERTRQFGLLSSLGASRRQLRRTVFVEALVLGAIGIPAGVALGLAGCWAVFGVLGEGLASMFSVSQGDVAATVVVSPVALGIAVALAFATLIVSAWVPAVRASRVSAVDAIRQTQDVRLTRRARRLAARAARRGRHGTGADRLARRPGLAGRLFGIPGHLAHRTLTRSAAKGRVTVAALAVSCALLVFAGSFADTMGYAAGTAVERTDIDLYARIDATATEGADGTTLRADGTYDAAGIARSVAALYRDAGEIEGAEPLGSFVSYVADIIMPAEMGDGEDAPLLFNDLGDTGWSATCYVDFLDEASWRAYVDELGLDEGRFCDPGHPLAIAVNAYNSNDGSTYRTARPFASTGTVQSVSFAAGAENEHPVGAYLDPDGNPSVWYTTSGDGEAADVYRPLDESITVTDTFDVGAVVDEFPACIADKGTPRFILPVSAIGSYPTMLFGNAGIALATDGDASAAARAEEALAQIAGTHPELDVATYNYAQSAQQNRLMLTTVNTFVGCFTAICVAIAVANVFNTLSNSLMLRRREFAVLRSIGMGTGAFRRMIAYECASLALRGFIIGTALSVLAAWGLWQSMSLSFRGYGFALPLGHLALAAGIILAVIAVSTVYALKKSRIDSVVDALRDDAI